MAYLFKSPVNQVQVSEAHSGVLSPLSQGSQLSPHVRLTWEAFKSPYVQATLQTN